MATKATNTENRQQSNIFVHSIIENKMKSRLIVKNFGPIKHVDLDLRNVNVFIGPQASGKSALAKLYTIFQAPRKFLNNTNELVKMMLSDNEIYIGSFKETLAEYNILSYLNSKTEIEFSSELHFLSYTENKIIYEPKLLKKIEDLNIYKGNIEENIQKIHEIITHLYRNYTLPQEYVRQFLDANIDFSYDILAKKITKENILKIIENIKNIELYLSSNAALYIPSERTFINIIKNSSFNLLLNNVPIPKHILLFGSQLENASIKEIDLGFLHKNLLYKKINGEDRIFVDSTNSIKLNEAASGIQSVLPLLLAIFTDTPYPSYFHKSFVIEEPELNLFPIAQYELIQLLEKVRDEPIGEDAGSIHTYTTHSPYMLSGFNNLLYAFKVENLITKREVLNGGNFRQENDKVKSIVHEIIPASINPDFFTAYQISDGCAESIFNRETGLIKDNYIDMASDKMADDFDALMNLMK